MSYVASPSAILLWKLHMEIRYAQAPSDHHRDQKKKREGSWLIWLWLKKKNSPRYHPLPPTHPSLQNQRGPASYGKYLSSEFQLSPVVMSFDYEPNEGPQYGGWDHALNLSSAPWMESGVQPFLWSERSQLNWFWHLPVEALTSWSNCYESYGWIDVPLL